MSKHQAIPGPHQTTSPIPAEAISPEIDLFVGAMSSDAIRVPPAPELLHQRGLQASLHARMRRKAIADGFLLLLLVLLTCSLSDSTETLLRNIILTAGGGIILYLLRRWQDLEALARADRWRSDALQGRGISLEDWHNGRNLAPWTERRKQDPT